MGGGGGYPRTEIKKREQQSGKTPHQTMKPCSNAHMHTQQTKVNTKAVLFLERALFRKCGLGASILLSSSGRHCTAVVIQTHLFPPSPSPHPSHLTSCFIVSAPPSLALPLSLLHTHTRLFVFPLGRTTVPGESIYWQDKKDGRCAITGPPLCPANLEVKRRAGVSNKVPPHSLYMQLH